MFPTPCVMARRCGSCCRTPSPSEGRMPCSPCVRATDDGPTGAGTAVSTDNVAVVEARLGSFVDKFDTGHAALIRECRLALRALLPTAVELVYDNYNGFVIGYSPTIRPSDCIVSMAAAAGGVGLSFVHGASLADPQGLLKGHGKRHRFIRLPRAAVLQLPEVVRLIRSAAALVQALPMTGARRTIIQSVSAKQRPRRKASREP